MLSAQEARPRARSPFAAAFLSLLFPGLGHAYAGVHHRALAFAAVPLLLVALAAGVVLRLPRTELLALALQPWVLTSVFVLNLLALAYRLVAIVDAYRVTAYLNAWTASGGGRLGRPRVPYHPLSVAGLLAVILVMAGAHVAVARYDLLVMQTADCVFDPDRACNTASPAPGGSGGPGPSEAPESGEPQPSLSLPPVGSALPNATTPPWNGRDRLNILLIGADEQGGAHNTDTLITVSIDPVTKQVAMFSLPRDTVNVPVPAGPARNALGPTYGRKINSLYLTLQDRPDLFPGGARTRGYNGLKAVLGELYGLDIKYFVEVNFDGFIRIVDALGGVTVNVQVPVVDDRFPGQNGRLQRVYIPAGVQHMTGTEALVYARSRNASNDFDRGQRQQRVLLSLARQLDPAAVLPRINELASALSTAVRTDIPRDLLPQLLGLAETVDLSTVRSYVFSYPNYADEVTAPIYFLDPDVPKIRRTVEEAFSVDPEFAARREALGAEGGTVWVLNGSGAQGQAAGLAAYLEYIGMTASSPAQRPDDTGLRATRIVVYNGAEARLATTIATLEELFGVEVQTATDPAARVDIVVTTGATTPTLTPPPAP
jgi:LCP family protein required for cell wall assembly